MDDMEKRFANASLIGWIHLISKNEIKYIKSQVKDLGLGHEVRYILQIYHNPNCSQDDLINVYGESKAGISKSLKKLEDCGYITREINPENRRKYMLKTTDKACELVPRIRELILDWENKAGLDEYDSEFRERMNKIAVNSMKLID